ncbi:MAG: ATP-binding protein [Nitrospira sp.]
MMLDTNLSEAVDERKSTPVHRQSHAGRGHRRESRRVKTALRLSSLPTGQTLAEFDFAFQPSVERSKIELLGTCGWVKNSETLLIQGPPAVGKSHLAIALGVKAVEHGFSAQFYRFDELLIELKRDADLPPARLRRRKYLSSGLLIIDELGFDPMTRHEASLFFRPVTYRYGRGSILITTNKSVREWPEVLAGDEVLSTAILDRLLHHAHVLNIKRRSYLLKDLESALAGAKAWNRRPPIPGAARSAGDGQINSTTPIPSTTAIRNFICRLSPQVLVSLDTCRLIQRSSRPQQRTSSCFSSGRSRTRTARSPVDHRGAIYLFDRSGQLRVYFSADASTSSRLRLTVYARTLDAGCT